MGMFNDLMQKIFRASAKAEAPPDAAKPGSSPESRVQAAARQAAAPATAAVAQQIDIEAILNGLAAKNPEKLDWKNSIVDLLKLVGMDSSLASRRALAADLKYTGNTNDTATMNMWLHKEVMKKLAENGGKVPKELLGH